MSGALGQITAVSLIVFILRHYRIAVGAPDQFLYSFGTVCKDKESLDMRYDTFAHQRFHSADLGRQPVSGLYKRAVIIILAVILAAGTDKNTGNPTAAE